MKENIQLAAPINRAIAHHQDDNSVLEPVVAFVHIPKTAGTTLRHIVQAQFKPQNVFEFYHFKIKPPKVLKGLERYHNLSLARKQELKFITGHFGFGLHEYIRRPCTYITVLRNPIERVISYYYFLARTQNDIVKDKTLEEFIQTFGGVHNSMACYLSGLTLKAQLKEPNLNLEQQRFAPEILEQAKTNLEQHFKVVGFVERFDETCILLKKILGWNIPSFYSRKNTSKRQNWSQDLPKDTLNLIEKYNALDLQLYDYAREIFEKLIEQQGDAFAEDLQSFKVANQSTINQFYFKIDSSYRRIAYRIYDRFF